MERIFPRVAAEQMERVGLTRDSLKSMSEKVALVRNKTQAHIDVAFVADPRRAWREAGIDKIGR